MHNPPKMPRLTENDLSRLPISDATRRLNPGLFGPGEVGRVDTPVDGKPKRALERKAQTKRGRSGGSRAGPGYCITFIAFIRRRMDDDNLAHACKPLRDAVADWLGVDDGDAGLRWEYGQVETRGQRGVCLKLERI